MKKKMIICTAAFIALLAVSAAAYELTDISIFLTLAITFGTFSYHFVMRLAVGLILNKVMKNQADYSKKWFQVHKWEETLFRKLKVRKWKDKMPTYDISLFDLNQHSLSEIIGAGCQAETIHEVIIILSFLPIFAGIRFGAYPVFIVTSLLSAAFDSIFVIIQRYNRPRLIRVMKKAEKRENPAYNFSDKIE